MDITVTLKGPLFEKKIDDVVKKAILAEGMAKFQDRIERPSARAQKRLGFRRNKLTGKTADLTLTVASAPLTQEWKPAARNGPKRKGSPRPKWQEKVPNYNPRRSGVTWQKKNVAIIKAMAPRQLKAIARRIVAELG